ncbi:uncharacterized protein VTP21DRAFT_1972 [Calcarisporiella thermophila]|uniref:uncharacterized protein n=1 Tax=Calcarisporiella thermophila TaxID=911321 RepID=UPI00374239FA
MSISRGESNLSLPIFAVGAFTKARWLHLFAFALLSFTSASLWITFAPLLFVFSSYYHVSPAAINFLSTIYMVTYPIFFYPALRLFSDAQNDCLGGGLRRGVLVGGLLNAAGAAIRYAGNSLFEWVFIGQMVCGIAQVFILAVPTRLSARAFPASERNLATCIGIAANNLGVAFGYLFPTLVIHPETVAADIEQCLFYQFLISFTILVVLVLAFYPPPEEDDRVEDEREPASPSALLMNRPFVSLMISYGIIIGAQYAVTTLISEIFAIFGREVERTLGILGFSLVVIGVASSLVVSVYLDRTNSHKPVCRWLYGCSIVSLVVLNGSLEIQSISLAYLSCILFGIFTYSISPAIFEFAGRSYALSEVATGGFLMSSSQVFAIASIFLMDSTPTSEGFVMRVPLWILTGMLAIGLGFQWSFGEEGGKALDDILR